MPSSASTLGNSLGLARCDRSCSRRDGCHGLSPGPGPPSLGRLPEFDAVALWVGTWVSLGYLAGKHIDAIYHNITRYSYYVLIALAVVLAGYIARHIVRRRRRRTEPASRQANASQAQSKPTARNGR